MSQTISTTPSRAGARPHWRARVERMLDHAPDTRSLFLRVVAGEPLRWLPGMFISISIPLANEVRVRPYTIASSPEDGEPLEICFNRVADGAGAAWLFERAAGDELEFTGPFGAFTLERAAAGETIFIAEGTAIAPIRPMIRRALAQPSVSALRLLHAADRPEHLLYRRELEQSAAAHPEFHFETLIAGPGHDALYAQLLRECERRWVGGDADRSRHFYICGVGKGVLAIRDLLRGAGYERRAVRYEQW
jgi:ferredoxin-NADP reductase